MAQVTDVRPSQPPPTAVLLACVHRRGDGRLARHEEYWGPQGRGEALCGGEEAAPFGGVISLPRMPTPLLI